MYGLNGTSCYTLVRGLLPGMIARGSGAIVGISSLMHKLPALAGGCNLRLPCVDLESVSGGGGGAPMHHELYRASCVLTVSHASVISANW